MIDSFKETVANQNKKISQLKKEYKETVASQNKKILQLKKTEASQNKKIVEMEEKLAGLMESKAVRGKEGKKRSREIESPVELGSKKTKTGKSY